MSVDEILNLGAVFFLCVYLTNYELHTCPRFLRQELAWDNVDVTKTYKNERRKSGLYGAIY